MSYKTYGLLGWYGRTFLSVTSCVLLLVNWSEEHKTKNVRICDLWEFLETIRLGIPRDFTPVWFYPVDMI